MGTLVGVITEVKKSAVMNDTWGHCFPEPGSKHPCKILVMAHDGEVHVLDRDSTAGPSPMEHDLVGSVVDLFDWSDGLHEIDCVLWFYKDCHNYWDHGKVGRIIKAKVKTLYCTERWDGGLNLRSDHAC